MFAYTTLNFHSHSFIHSFIDFTFKLSLFDGCPIVHSLSQNLSSPQPHLNELVRFRLSRSCSGLGTEHVEHAGEHLLPDVVVGQAGHGVGVAELAPEVAQQVGGRQGDPDDVEDQPLKVEAAMEKKIFYFFWKPEAGFWVMAGTH